MATVLTLIADLVEFVVGGLPFTKRQMPDNATFSEVLAACVDVAIVEFTGQSIKIGDNILVIGDTYNSTMLTEHCATHGTIARAVAPGILLAIQSDVDRKTLQSTAKRSQTIAVNAANALHAYDTELAKPYDLRAILSVWAIDCAKMVVNDHTTVLDTPTVQGKTPSEGSGNRVLYWSDGTYIIDNKSIYTGCVLTIGDGLFQVTRNGDEIFSATYGKPGDRKLTALGQSAWEVMYRLAENLAEADVLPAHPNLPRMWGMAKLPTEVLVDN